MMVNNVIADWHRDKRTEAIIVGPWQGLDTTNQKQKPEELQKTKPKLFQDQGFVVISEDSYYDKVVHVRSEMIGVRT